MMSPANIVTEIRALADRAFSRAAGSPLLEGNYVRLLKDARENYPAWLDAIGAAKRHIHLESYIIHEDDTGRKFGDALLRKAREGVRVRLIYDWVGGFGKTSRRFWNRLRAGRRLKIFRNPVRGVASKPPTEVARNTTPRSSYPIPAHTHRGGLGQMVTALSR